MKNIIVIEDDLIIRENIVQILIENSFLALGFENGDFALKEINGSPIPDLIICDIMMPEKSGYDIIKTLKNDERTHNIPFIFVTAKAENSDLRKGMELGANDYLIKPFTIKQLLASVNLRIEERDYQNKTIEVKLSEKLDAIKIITNHEYSTPLNGIVGLTDIMLFDLNNLEKKDIKEYLEAIRASAKRLIKSNNKLFQIVNLLANNEPPLSDSIYINEIRTILKNSAKSIKKENLNELQVIFEMPNLTGDKFITFSTLHLLEIINEMLENAFKFAAKKTTIKIIITLLKNHTFNISVQNINHINNCFISDLNFLSKESCINGSASSFKSGLYIISKLCKLNNAEFKISKNDEIVTSTIQIGYIIKKRSQNFNININQDVRK